MPKNRPAGSVAEPALKAWIRKHPEAPGVEVARARLEFMEAEGTARFMRTLLDKDHVRPRMLRTSQISGRWSTTNPPLNGLPKPVRDVMVPESGTWWMHMDKQAVEGRLAAVYADERRDLDVLDAGGDLHMATLRDMFPTETIADGDPRRQLAKTTRYNLLYAWDEKGILEAKDLSVFGTTHDAIAFARRFMAARPAITAAKQRVFADSWRTHEARSGYGRIRRLTGDQKTQGKDGWSQTIQGTVSSMMNRLLLRMLSLDKRARLILYPYDGVIISWPGDLDRELVVNTCRHFNDEPVTLWGKSYVYPADWHVQEAGV